MKKWCLIVVALLFIGVAIVAFAAPPDGNAQTSPGVHKSWPGGPHHTPAFPLGLSKEQMDKMREIRGRFRADTHDLRYDLAVKKLEMRKFFTDPKTDDATLLAKEKELNDLRLRLMERTFKMRLEWRKVLTPEQIQKLDRLGRRYRHHSHHMSYGPHRQRD